MQMRVGHAAIPDRMPVIGHDLVLIAVENAIAVGGRAYGLASPRAWQVWHRIDEHVVLQEE
jgi:hypothetical protein